MTKTGLAVAGVALSALLFAAKLWAGLTSGSVAVLSDALNSFLDVISYTIVYVGIRVHALDPDENHPFGHRRAEPLAGLVIAILAVILAVTIGRDALLHLRAPQDPEYSVWTFAILIGAGLAKALIAAFYRRAWRRTGSPALRASFVDSRNDVLATALALTGFILGGALDAAAGLAIGAWILFSGGRLGTENLRYLMGHAPTEEMLASIRRAATVVPGVQGLNDVRAHYVGDRIHVEIHIEVDGSMASREAHDIGVAVKQSIERLHLVDKAFVHIDPV